MADTEYSNGVKGVLGSRGWRVITLWMLGEDPTLCYPN